jgi:hypothetical protein
VNLRSVKRCLPLRLRDGCRALNPALPSFNVQSSIMAIKVTPLVLGLIIVAWMASVWFACRMGRRSQKMAERLKAKIAVSVVIDRISSEVAKHPRVVDLFFGTRDEVRTAVSKLSCQSGKRRRTRIHKALNQYQTLDIKGRSGMGHYAGTNGEMQEADRRQIVDSLKILKDEISAA